MKGLELARQYYEAFGKEMLASRFPGLLPYLAVGLAGSGSECYGYDDETSRDHDFEPGFCIFLPGEDVVNRREAFQLERAYAKLPKEFMGTVRSPLSPVGGNRHGVIRMEDFFLEKAGSPDGVLSPEQWLSLPEYGLLEATNGEVFSDPYGKFSAIRERLGRFPEDIRRKKLAGYLLLMGQSGQYNYPRCIKRGDTAAAQMAAFEFTQSALHCLYLINHAYTPYYKWCFRGLRDLPLLSDTAGVLEHLISSGNLPAEAKEKAGEIEGICQRIARTLQEENLCEKGSDEMEHLAYMVNDAVSDSNLRNLHILYGV